MKSFQKVIAAVATCAALGNSAIVPASAQEASADAARAVEFTSDSAPFSKPYTPQPVVEPKKSAPVVPLETTVTPSETPVTSPEATLAPPETSVIPSQPTILPQRLDPINVSLDEAEIVSLPATKDALPIEAEPGYTVTLTVPKSVQAIEVAANGQTEPGHRFKLQLGSSQPALNASQEQPNAELNRILQLTAPVERKLPTVSTAQSGTLRQPGFQRNPYFQSSNHQVGAAMTASANPVNTPNSKPGLHSTLASYEPPERDLAPPIAIDQLQLELAGPSVMGMERNADFSIRVTNGASDDAHDVNVVLQYASGLEIVVLDRDAAVDLDNRQIQWTIPKLAAGQVERIQYRVKSVAGGGQAQQVSFGRQPTARASRINTVVQAEFDTAEAPMLPFETIRR